MRGKIVTAFIFLTMMTGAVSAAPVLDYTGAEWLEEARQREEERQERLRIPRIENIESSLNEKEETQGAALEPVFRINEIILSGQGESHPARRENGRRPRPAGIPQSGKQKRTAP